MTSAVRVKKIQWEMIGFLALIFGCALTLVLTFVILAPTPKFAPGVFVVMTLSKQKGMVHDYVCTWRGCIYGVRIEGHQSTTDARLLSDDGAVQSVPYSIIRAYEFEIERAE